jgi:hypothetical protein
VLSWQRLDHLFHGSGQIFGVLFDGKFGISEAQHTAAASSDIEQSALLGALDLQLQILLGDLEHGVRADGEGRGQGGWRDAVRTSITIGCFFFWKKTEPIRCGSIRTCNCN